MTLDPPWRLAGRVAAQVAGNYPLADSYHAERLASDLVASVGRAAATVATETGLPSPGEPVVLVVSRAEWAERNLASFSHLLGPAERRIAERLAREGKAARRGAALSRGFMVLETGALLGAIARRVLGQYELVLPTGDDGGAVTFVGANILALERLHQFRPSDFRLWIALHECTHRAQFMGVPWLRTHFLGLVQQMVDAAGVDPDRWQRLATEIAAAWRQKRPMLDERGVLGLLANPRQREVLDRIQALMCLLEGHGHVVMDRIGARMLRTQERMSRTLKLRRKDRRVATFLRLTGLEMKLRQYELGESFVKGVEEAAGWGALSHAWESPDSLPTLAEIEHPELWLRRVA